MWQLSLLEQMKNLSFVECSSCILAIQHVPLCMQYSQWVTILHCHNHCKWCFLHTFINIIVCCHTHTQLQVSRVKRYDYSYVVCVGGERLLCFVMFMIEQIKCIKLNIFEDISIKLMVRLGIEKQTSEVVPKRPYRNNLLQVLASH